MIAETLGSLLSKGNRTALTPESDRVAIPAPSGARRLVEAVAGIGQDRCSRYCPVAPAARRRIPCVDEGFHLAAYLAWRHKGHRVTAPGGKWSRPRQCARPGGDELWESCGSST